MNKSFSYTRTVVAIITKSLNIMNNLLFLVISKTDCLESCQIDCPTKDEEMVCAFEINSKTYKMFPSNCVMKEIAKCNNEGKKFV